MGTTIVNPTPNNNNIGLVIGIFALVIVGAVFFIYGLPYIKGITGSGGIQVNVPKSIDVKVQQSKK